jgi:hypothetical protein
MNRRCALGLAPRLVYVWCLCEVVMIQSDPQRIISQDTDLGDSSASSS